MTKRIIFLLVLMCSLALLASCDGEESGKQCERDGDCPPAWRCDTYAYICRCVSDEGCDRAAGEVCMPNGTCQIYTGCGPQAPCPSLWSCEESTGECLCIGDESCLTGEVCNASGYCQPSAGCFDNDDCGQGDMCDTPSKTCMPVNTCNTKYQCPIGNLCSGGLCVPGCDDYGDCPLGSGCIEGNCMQGVCEEDEFCDFREYCSNGNCLDAYSANTPYCKPCDGQNMMDCGLRQNPCLIYPFDDDAFIQGAGGLDEYCSVDCSGNQSCPNGFVCNSIITVKQTDLCRADNECPGSLPCLIPQEEDNGYCPCHDTQNPCMANTCLTTMMCGTFTNTCLLLDLPCQTDADCYMCSVTTLHCTTNADCPAIQCEKYDGVDYGGCVSAQGCGLDEGYHCPAP